MTTYTSLQGKPADFDQCFPDEVKYDEASKTFEIGLVMGGTVSSGAYTAGVIDFLIEALDNWQLAKENGDDVPDWKVKLKVVTGTSGGGVTAALLARALSFDFPPVRKGSSPEEQAANPFYRIWVKEVDIHKMLDTADIDGPEPTVSLLNARVLDNCAWMIANFDKAFPTLTLKSATREFVDNPLPIYLTLTNLRGIPYRIDMGDNGLQQEYVNHADYVRMAVFSQGLNSAYQVRPDEFTIGGNVKNAIPWSQAVQYALGTSAFPLGFPLRSLSRPIQHYRYRAVVVANSSNPIRHIEPIWTDLAVPPISTSHGMVADIVEDEYHFVAADGGMTNNEPIELCRTALAGFLNSNPRGGNDAYRALILIDPFADKATLGPKQQPELLKAIAPLVSAWKNQARYDSRDLLLAADSNVFSRFMITAKRDGEVAGGKSIATACASAFGGFLSERFRRHDYLLGRKNCQDFLINTFNLPVSNALVKDWANAHPTSTLIANGKIRLLPLCGASQFPEQTESFPKGAFDVDAADFQDRLAKRIDRLVDKAQGRFSPHGAFPQLYLAPLFENSKSGLQTKINDWLKSALQEWGL